MNKGDMSPSDINRQITFPLNTKELDKVTAKQIKFLRVQCDQDD